MKWVFSAIVVFFAAGATVGAQNYNIDWFTIDGGGGTSSGGTYTLSGTIGQPDAGKLTGGNYTIQGGFWGVVTVVQTPGTPSLRIVKTSTNAVVIAWPSFSPNFSLQMNSSIATTNWATVTNVPIIVGDEKQVTISTPTGNNFFRLKSP